MRMFIFLLTGVGRGYGGGGGGHEKGDAASQLRRRAGECVYAYAIPAKKLYPLEEKAIHLYTNAIQSATIVYMSKLLRIPDELYEAITERANEEQRTITMTGQILLGQALNAHKPLGNTVLTVSSKEEAEAMEGFELHGDTVTSPSPIDPADALDLAEEKLFEQARQYQEEVDAYDASINQDPEGAFQIERKKRWLDDFWVARMQP